MSMRVTESQLRKIVREEILREVTQGNTKGLLGGAYGNPQPHRQSVTNDLTGHTAQLSEGLQYHLSTGTRLDENVYRPGTPEFFALFNEARRLYRAGVYEATDTEAELLESDIGRWGVFEGTRVPLDFPMWDESDIIPEAKYQGREVTLGVKGAKRSGGRAHVYVRDPKSGKVKKISFGSGMPDAMGDSEAHRKRRKSFGDRHDCAGKKDKMKAGYWACRATKMFGRNIPGWW